MENYFLMKKYTNKVLARYAPPIYEVKLKVYISAFKKKKKILDDNKDA